MRSGRFGSVVLGLAATMVLAAIAVNLAGLMINATYSAPVGLWRVSPVDVSTLQRGELVEVCPPDMPIVRAMEQLGALRPGDCPKTNSIPLLKPVSAVAGDTVTITHGQPVRVNGRTLPNTTALQQIPAWPDGTYTVEPGRIWVFSTYMSGSFDSRYFGPVAVANVIGKATPVLTNGDASKMTLVEGARS